MGAARKIDGRFLDSFIDGATETLRLQCSTECRPMRSVLKGKEEAGPVDISGVIGIACESFSGSIALCFPKKTFLGIMGNMLGENYLEISQDVEDAAGELLNIIYGHAKKRLNEDGHSLEKAIPKIVRGTCLSRRSTILSFETEFGPFFIEVSDEREA